MPCIQCDIVCIALSPVVLKEDTDVIQKFKRCFVLASAIKITDHHSSSWRRSQFEHSDAKDKYTSKLTDIVIDKVEEREDGKIFFFTFC